MSHAFDEVGRGISYTGKLLLKNFTLHFVLFIIRGGLYIFQRNIRNKEESKGFFVCGTYVLWPEISHRRHSQVFWKPAGIYGLLIAHVMVVLHFNVEHISRKVLRERHFSREKLKTAISNAYMLILHDLPCCGR